MSQISEAVCALLYAGYLMGAEIPELKQLQAAACHASPSTHLAHSFARLSSQWCGRPTA